MLDEVTMLLRNEITELRLVGRIMEDKVMLGEVLRLEEPLKSVGQIAVTQ